MESLLSTSAIKHDFFKITPFIDKIRLPWGVKKLNNHQIKPTETKGDEGKTIC